MDIQSITFGALIPAPGFRWIYEDPSGKWLLREPPKDWPEQDYASARFYDDHPPEPELTDRFYLAASLDECMWAHHDQRTNFGRAICEPDLYLQFASLRPTPATISGLANQYGLLRYEESLRKIPRKDCQGIVSAFSWDESGDKTNGGGKSAASDTLYLRLESARDWMLRFEGQRHLILAWKDERSTGGYAAMNDFLEDGFNYALGGSLTYQVKMDPESGKVRSEIMATSLADALDVQWGMSLAADTIHRQCSECPTWFAVHPGSGRPDKQFCSDACRMRAYRKRKAGKKSRVAGG